MLSKNIDVVALLVIALTLLLFSRPLVPTPVLGQVRAADFRIHQTLGRFQVCPFTGAPIPRFR